MKAAVQPPLAPPRGECEPPSRRRAHFPRRRGLGPAGGRGWIPAALGLALLAGCSTASYDIKIASVAKPEAKSAISYRIETDDPGIDTSTLRYKEAENFVKTALSGKGMYEAPKPELADVVVELDYGLGPPVLKQLPMSEPIYETVPGTTQTQEVQTGVDAKGSPVYSTVVTQEPSRDTYVGDREYMITVTTYEKRLILTAHENKPMVEGRPAKTVWGVQVTSEDESKDLRKYLPALIGASIEYIGRDTGQIKTIKLGVNDPAIAFIRKGL